MTDIHRRQGLKSSIFSVAKRTYLLTDSSKFNTYDLNGFAALSQVDGVITDAGSMRRE